MCAIFGFIARSKSAPRVETLAKIVQANIHRGPHSFGFAWIDGDGRLHSYKQCGRFTDQLGVLALARKARMLIGHLRYATHGAPEENINNHPHPADGGWIVHNGVIGNYRQLIHRHKLWPVSDCDSESLGLLIERGDGPLLRRCANSIEETDGSLAMMGLWARPAALVVARRGGNPLHISEGPDGIYLATLDRGLPGKPSTIRDETVRQYTRTGTAIKCRTIKIVSEMEQSGALFDEAGEYRGG